MERDGKGVERALRVRKRKSNRVLDYRKGPLCYGGLVLEERIFRMKASEKRPVFLSSKG